MKSLYLNINTTVQNRLVNRDILTLSEIFGLFKKKEADTRGRRCTRDV